jgi:hypothetical membrane protein
MKMKRRDQAYFMRYFGLSDRQLAGVLMVLAGSVILMGIISAEALYPDTYTTHDNEISDLGATRPPNSIIHQPSATVFNITMMVSGTALIASSFLIHRAYGVRRVTVLIALLGIGALGVGVFPGNKDPFHPIFALMAFLSGGIAALASAKVQTRPSRFISMLLGTIVLLALLVGLSGEPSNVVDELGDGGVERWIAYPVVLWLVAFGGYLTNANSVDEAADVPVAQANT